MEWNAVPEHTGPDGEAEKKTGKREGRVAGGGYRERCRIMEEKVKERQTARKEAHTQRLWKIAA